MGNTYRRKTSEEQGFKEEQELIDQANKLMAQTEPLPYEVLLAEFKKLLESYSTALEETKVIMSVSDRLQNKLNKVNLQVTEKNDLLEAQAKLLEEKNKEIEAQRELLAKINISKS